MGKEKEENVRQNVPLPRQPMRGAESGAGTGWLAVRGWRRVGRCRLVSEPHFPCDFCHLEREEGRVSSRMLFSHYKSLSTFSEYLSACQVRLAGGNLPRAASEEQPSLGLKEPRPTSRLPSGCFLVLSS